MKTYRRMIAALCFFSYLVELKIKGKAVTARDVCVLSFWAKGAEMTGQGASLALHPSTSGGIFNSKSAKASGLSACR